MLFNLGSKFQKRTYEDYKEDVAFIKRENVQKFRGLKGSSVLEDLGLKLPDNIIIDYMHCALEGTVKKLLDLWFNSNNHHYDFYLNSKIKNIDKILLKIQYPSELPRNQRTLVNYNLFKAIMNVEI